MVHLVIGTGTLTGISASFPQFIITTERDNSYNKSHYRHNIPAILLSKLYANSMMVFLNYRAPALRGLDGQVISDVVTVPLGFLRFGTATGPADAAQE